MFTTKVMMLVGLGLGAGLLACGSNQETPMTASSSVPAAQGEINTKKGDNGNTVVTVMVKHLAQPAKVKEGATTYVVWLEPNGTPPPQNVGALQVDKDLLGTLTTTTPHADFVLSITAEEFTQAAAPTGPEVFRTTVHSP